MHCGQVDRFISDAEEGAMVSALAFRTRRLPARKEALEMMRTLSILFAGWVVKRVLAENRIQRPTAPSRSGRKRQSAGKSRKKGIRDDNRRSGQARQSNQE
jgi:hypothetical protein